MNSKYEYIFRSVISYRLRFFLITIFIVLSFSTFGITLGLLNVLHPDNKSNEDRQLLVLNSLNSQLQLPFLYKNHIERIEGVKAVSYSTWVGAFFRNPTWSVPVWAVDNENFFNLNQDIIIESAVYDIWKKQRNGILVDKRFAEKYSLKVGERLPLQSSIWSLSNGGVIDLIISGIIDIENKKNPPNLFIHYDYFESLLLSGKGLVSYFIVVPNNDTSLDSLGSRIDSVFEGNLYQGTTKSATKDVHNQQIISKMFDVEKALKFINISIFSLLFILLTSNIYVIFEKKKKEYYFLHLCGYSKNWIIKTSLLQVLIFIFPGVLTGIILGSTMVNLGSIYGPLSLQGLELKIIDYIMIIILAFSVFLFIAPIAIFHVLSSKRILS